MRLIKQLNQPKTDKRTYSDTKFKRSFASFLEALVINKLADEQFDRIKTDEGYVWNNTLTEGGVKLVTSHHPQVRSSSDVTVYGSKQALELFESIISSYATFLGEHDEYDVEVTYDYHNELNPLLWTSDNELQTEVADALEEDAAAFFKYLGTPQVDIVDVIITGSNANYNWTDDSDIDLHIVVDMPQAESVLGPIAPEYFKAKTKNWNDTHDIKIRGIPVEFYVQDDNEIHHSSGIFSLIRNRWIVEPKHDEPDINDIAVKRKTAHYMNLIDDIVDHGCTKADKAEALFEKIKKMRKAGLDKAGEFSTENLVFKTLRNNGYIGKLSNLRDRAFDRALSIEDEEWDFN